MLPKLTLLSGFAFILWMFAKDRRWRRLPSNALWIPAIWLAMGSSRSMSFWFYALGLSSGNTNRLEGSPVNVIFNNGLFLAAILVLYQRRFSWAKYAFANKAVFSIYAFFLCSALWSPFPVATVKRLVQEFGWMLVAPIILTEQDPAASLRMVFVRVSYVLFPLSPILMRYFPNIGRSYSVNGAVMMSGVADHKNSLGQLCMVFCLVAIWDLMETRKCNTTSSKKPESWVRVLNLGIGLYLLVISSSATALMCFLFGLVLLVVSKRLAAMKNARRVFMLGVLATVCLLALEQEFQVSSRISEAWGRGAGLSGRTEIWRVTLEKSAGYLVGAGFHGFWETSAGKAVYEELGTGELLTAHNGYLETYLNGGVVGLFFLAVFIWSTGLKATAKLVEGEPIGRLAVVFWPILLIYNLTESQFMMAGPVWFAMLLMTSDYRREEATVRVRTAWERQPPRQLSGPSAAAMVGAAAAHREILNRRQGSWNNTRRQER
jgi:O-antigen ligase